MDEHLQTLARAVRADPGNAELARRCRAELRRARSSGAAEALLDDLAGVVATVESWSVDLGEKSRGRPRWRWATPDNGGPVWAQPAPSLRRRAVAWRARGVALWRSSGLILLERGDHALEARDLHTGEVRWRVPSVQPRPEVLTEEERAVVLPWVVAPWGAVEVLVRYEAPLLYRRVGRYHAELGRVTDRTPVDRGPVEVEVTLGAAIPEGGRWSARPPEEVREDLGSELDAAGLRLDDWSLDPIRLALDLGSPCFGISWDEPEQWAMLRLTGGGDLPTSAAAAGWVPEAHPFPENAEAGQDDTSPAWCAEIERLVADHLDGRALLPWSEPWTLADGAAQAAYLPGEGPLTIQLGTDELLVFEAA